MSKYTPKVGDKVRIKRGQGNYHGVKFGAVGTVEVVGVWDVIVRVPTSAMQSDWRPAYFGLYTYTDTQFIEHADLIPARQAMKS